MLTNSSKVAENKENQQNKYAAAYEPVKNENSRHTNYEDVNVQDINSKLSRLQDLLQKAKQQ